MGSNDRSTQVSKLLENELDPITDDLLKLVEEHRYVAKNPPTPSARKGSKRK
jgi:hypothetical protein